MADSNLLDQRKKLKSKKPEFRRHDSHKKDKLSKNWRRPKGLQNKVRLRKRGYVRRISTGWGSPNEVKGLHPSGLEPVNVHNVSELEGLKKDVQGVIIGSKVGARKRLAIIEECKKKNLKILNIDPDKYVKKVEERLSEKKKVKKEKEAKKPTPETKSSEKKDEDLTEEEKKEKEKKEKDKVLTKSK